MPNWSCNAQAQILEDEIQTLNRETYRYYLYTPAEYAESGDKDHPLLLFLHGGGESGQELASLKKHGPPKMMAEGYPFPFLVLAPQHPHEKKWWNVHAVKQLLDSIIANHRVDKSRIYLTGLSRGGTAAWELAVQYPDTFAAMAVVCGMTPVPYAHWINPKMPIWVFHGDKDQVIPVDESDAMVKKLKSFGHPIKYTRYEGVGHEAWIPAYKNDSLYTWFIKHKL